MTQKEEDMAYGPGFDALDKEVEVYHRDISCENRIPVITVAEVQELVGLVAKFRHNYHLAGGLSTREILELIVDLLLLVQQEDDLEAPENLAVSVNQDFHEGIFQDALGNLPLLKWGPKSHPQYLKKWKPALEEMIEKIHLILRDLGFAVYSSGIPSEEKPPLQRSELQEIACRSPEIVQVIHSIHRKANGKSLAPREFLESTLAELAKREADPMRKVNSIFQGSSSSARPKTRKGSRNGGRSGRKSQIKLSSRKVVISDANSRPMSLEEKKARNTNRGVSIRDTQCPKKH